MNSQNMKTSKQHVSILNVTDKTDLQRDEKSVALSNLKFYYTWKNIKNSYNNNKVNKASSKKRKVQKARAFNSVSSFN